MEERGGFRRALVSLQHPDYRLLFASQVVTALGNEFLNVSNAWQIFALTGSPLHLGLAGVVRAVAVFLFSLVGGVVADRVDRRQIIVCSQLATGALALLLATLTLIGAIQVWHIYAVLFLNNTLATAANPARRAAVAAVVPRHHLMNAMVLQAFVAQADRIGAPAVAGLLIALVGTPLTYAINGLTHLVNAVTVLEVRTDLAPQRPTGRAASGTEGRPRGSRRLARGMGEAMQDVLEGLVFVRQRPIILVIVVMDGVAMLFGNYVVLLPVLADQFEVGPVGFGLLGSAVGVGSVLAAGTLLSLGDFRYKGWLIGGAFIGYAVFLAVLGLAPWFPLALMAVAGLGCMNALQAQTRNALIQLLTPDGLRGRVGAFQSILQSGSPQLGQGVLGASAALIGAGPALVVGAILCGTINLAILVWRRDLRASDLGERQAEEEEHAARLAAATARG